VFEIDGPIVDQRHMVWSRRGLRLASDVIAVSDDPGRLGRSDYTYFHAPMVAGTIATVVADELTVAHPGGDVTAGTAAMILGGPAVTWRATPCSSGPCSHTGRGHGPWRSPAWP
jgi:low temperature requirement protein LtrA